MGPFPEMASNRTRIMAFLFALICAAFLILPIFSNASYDGFPPLALNYGNIKADATDDNVFLLGVGKADITGPVVEINMMGYADTNQQGTGLRQRIYCRAFIVGHPNKTDERLAYLVLDTQSGDTAIRHGILNGIAALGPEFKMYNKDNVAVTGTHSHSGPGAWLNYLLPQITSKGFSKESYQAIVDGSVLAIKRAHESLAPGYLSLGNSSSSGISVSRSAYAYLANPEAERARYETDTDTDITVLRFDNATSGKMSGILTWLPVHGTSLYQNNTLIAGDNKGVAAYLFEKSMEQDNPAFVAGFSQSNVGDTSPNVLGAFCEDTGLPCKFDDSTCGGKTQGCHGRGPWYTVLDQGTKSCYEIGMRQFKAAQAALADPSMKKLELSTISSFHVFTNLSSYTFVSPFNQSKVVQTCSAALGYGFAGGTTDGPGAFDFQQGTNDTDGDSPALKNPLWRVARDFVHDPSDEQIACQHPKPILLDVGAATQPYAWAPNIVDSQTMRIGSLIIIVSPGEATTMSGRRWRENVASAAKDVLKIENPYVVLGGPANTYTHYIATEEEYGVQRYEGASTLHGPHTLEAYVNLSLTYLPYLSSEADITTLSAGPSPPINVDNSLSFITPVVVDNAGFFKNFGQTLSSPDPAKTFTAGQTVSAHFIGANPRNNFRLEGTFAAVEQYNANTGAWETYRNDNDWSLVYSWKRTSTVLGTSEVQIDWEIESGHTGTDRDMYRIKYYGDSKALGGKITPFEGTSGTFYVARSSATQQKSGELFV